MSVESQLTVETTFLLTPERLAAARKRVPVVAHEYIPLTMFDVSFDMEEPKFEQVGRGAVRMALQRPFGFMEDSQTPGKPNQTQLTDGLIIAPASGALSWIITLNTSKHLSAIDEHLFRYGVSFYANHVHRKIRR